MTDSDRRWVEDLYENGWSEVAISSMLKIPIQDVRIYISYWCDRGCV